MVLQLWTASCLLLAYSWTSSAHGQGVLMEAWGNGVMQGPPASARNFSALSGSWQATPDVFSVLWSGSIVPSTSGSYWFNCSFLGGVGIGWVDGHVLCTHGMSLYRYDVGPGPIPLTAGKPYSLRFQFAKNSTAPIPSAAEMLWGLTLRPTDDPKMVPIPVSDLVNTLSSQPQTQMALLQKSQYDAAGWGSWYPHNLLSVTRLPDGAQVTVGLCQLSSGSCELSTVNSAGAVRLGIHSVDGSFVTYSHAHAGLNVTVSWGNVPSIEQNHLRLTVKEAICNNCSDYEVVLIPSFCDVWTGSGNLSVDEKKSSLYFSPAGLPDTLLSVTGVQLTTSQLGRIDLTEEFLAFSVSSNAEWALVVSSVSGETAIETESKLGLSMTQELEKYAAYGTPELAELKEAIRASTMWLVVYVPYATGLILTLSRGSMGGGNSQCDWDNFFAAMMLGSDEDGRDLGFTTFAQTLGSRTVDGFVPNGANAAKKSRDRTEPIVGAKVLKAFVDRFGIDQTGWLAEWSFEQLFGWHDWAWRRRRHAPLGLISPGSDPITPLVDPSDWGINTMQGARWETGMDNSPMYDGPDSRSHNKSGPILFNNVTHHMELYDVGMTAGLASDMMALAEIGKALLTARQATSCSQIECKNILSKLPVIEGRAGTLNQLTQEHLWQDEVSAFTNKMPAAAYGFTDDKFYTRVSPTSFYPLMTGTPSVSQVDRTVKAHLLNPTGFCITPENEWPPLPNPLDPNAVLLQSWRLPEQVLGHQLISLCIASMDTLDAPEPGSCAALAARGAHFVRNESYGWSIAPSSPSRAVPLYPYSMKAGNETLLARDGDFPNETKLSLEPVVWIIESNPPPGSWPITLWNLTFTNGSKSFALWRATGGPASNNEVAGSWNQNFTLGYTTPLQGACYWGLPSISFDDPAFGSPGNFVYWRGNAWAPLAMLTYWGLNNEAYANISSVQVAKKGLANSYSKMWMETAWRPSHTVCENYCVHERGGCCGDTFYHWGALAGFMALLEAGK